MADLPAAIAAAREALARLRKYDGGKRYYGDYDAVGTRSCCFVESWTPHDSACPHAVAVAKFDRLLAALDAAQGEAVAWLCDAGDGKNVEATVSENARDHHARRGRTVSSLYLAPPDLVTQLDHARRRIGQLTIQLGEVMKAPPAQPVAVAYNEKRIAWELERTAMGDGFYGNALRVAKDLPGITAEDRAVLDRVATGMSRSTDHVALQGIASRIYFATNPCEVCDGTGSVRSHMNGRDNTHPCPRGCKPAPVAVPAGYALVPVEPTDDMVRAGAWEYAECKENDVFSRPAAENIWSQMVMQATLAAALAAKENNNG